jgi:hypothetical protein
MARLLGAAAVFLGGIIIGLNPGRHWDPVLIHFHPGVHGISVTDLLGMASLSVGVVVLWRAAPRDPPPA